LAFTYLQTNHSQILFGPDTFTGKLVGRDGIEPSTKN
jgi:hypothetical protein